MRKLFPLLCVAAIAASVPAQAPRQSAPSPRLFNTIRFESQKVFDGITTLGTSDIWSPHNLNYTFEIEHLSRRLDLLVPIEEPDQWIYADIERLTYSDGHRVDRENPEDFYTAITNIKLLRPDNPAGLDGGLSVSWTRLLERDENTSEYLHHHNWIADSERWRPAVEAADYWCSAHYRDGHTQWDWVERLEVFNQLYRQQFGDKPLMIVIWHRERVGPDRNQEWITMRDYIEMGLTARDLGCHVMAFGLEDDPTRQNFEQAQSYFSHLSREWQRRDAVRKWRR